MKYFALGLINKMKSYESKNNTLTNKTSRNCNNSLYSNSIISMLIKK